MNSKAKKRLVGAIHVWLSFGRMRSPHLVGGFGEGVWRVLGGVGVFGGFVGGALEGSGLFWVGWGGREGLLFVFGSFFRLSWYTRVEGICIFPSLVLVLCSDHNIVSYFNRRGVP